MGIYGALWPCDITTERWWERWRVQSIAAVAADVRIGDDAFLVEGALAYVTDDALQPVAEVLHSNPVAASCQYAARSS